MTLSLLPHATRYFQRPASLPQLHLLKYRSRPLPCFETKLHKDLDEEYCKLLTVVIRISAAFRRL